MHSFWVSCPTFHFLHHLPLPETLKASLSSIGKIVPSSCFVHLKFFWNFLKPTTWQSFFTLHPTNPISCARPAAAFDKTTVQMCDSTASRLQRHAKATGFLERDQWDAARRRLWRQDFCPETPLNALKGCFFSEVVVGSSTHLKSLELQNAHTHSGT